MRSSGRKMFHRDLQNRDFCALSKVCSASCRPARRDPHRRAQTHAHFSDISLRSSAPTRRPGRPVRGRSMSNDFPSRPPRSRFHYRFITSCLPGDHAWSRSRRANAPAHQRHRSTTVALARRPEQDLGKVNVVRELIQCVLPASAPGLPRSGPVCRASGQPGSCFQNTMRSISWK